MTRPPPPDLLTYGIARLPRHVSGADTETLVIEFSLDEGGVITAVGTTVRLPGYEALLCSLLCGRDMDTMEDTARRLEPRLRGPLLRPTLAALTNALANYRQAHTSGEAAG